MIGEHVVIGLGVFGRAVAADLVRLGQSVLAIDLDQDNVQRVADTLDAAVCADATVEETLRELGVERSACAVVAIGAESREASILVTALLRQIGVPRIVARAVSDLHARVLLAVGATEVVNPEAEMGERLARRLAQPSLLEHLELDEQTRLAEVAVPAAFIGRSLAELEIRRRYGVTVVALKRVQGVHSIVDPTEHLEPGDVMVVIGSPDSVRRLAALV
jgi:trk system potassium uptake protein